MIGYVCKYTPIEILQCFGQEVLRIDPAVSGFDRADALTHPNLCTYAKAVLEEIEEKSLERSLDGIVLVTCCDSIRRLYDVLKKRAGFQFIHMIDVPRKNNPNSARCLSDEIRKLIKAYEQFSGSSFNGGELAKGTGDCCNQERRGEINVALMGARCKQTVLEAIERAGGTVSHNFTCTGSDRGNIRFEYQDDLDRMLYEYAESLLNSYPCMRMENVDERLSQLNNNQEISGIIYHTVKFCDSYSYEYAHLQDKLSLPILKIETDYTAQGEGQVQTRIEAFVESLKAKNLKVSAPVAAKGGKGGSRTMEKDAKAAGSPVTRGGTGSCLVAGIDSGSTSTNVVIMDGSKNIVSYSVVRTGAKSIDSAQRAYKDALEKGNLAEEEISLVVSTGYGRVSIPFADLNVTEITCHGKGANFVNNKVRTIIDIGGQDSKIIRINEKGEVTDFVMNDKCAAGTGRFLEMMARTLEIPIEEMGPESLKWKEDVSITNMCTVFAESEVISLIAQNKERADIIHGLHNSVARKIVSLLGRVGKTGAYMMTGGVAKNIGVVRAIEDKLGEKLVIYHEPEIVGAIGAAIIGIERING